LGDDKVLKAGDPVTTWGFPLIYNGPAPLLSVGYLSGFEAVQQGDKVVKHLVANGAFNPVILVDLSWYRARTELSELSFGKCASSRRGLRHS